MRVLVSGAGVAGLSTAITLGACGHEVTLLERADHLRTTGSPIDIRGDALAVADRMGVLDQIRAARIDMTERVQFVDRTGAVVAEIPPDQVNDSADDIEIPRPDLATILGGALSPTTEVRLGESIAALHDDPLGVDVELTSGGRDRYDLVVGADGLHSATRRMCFGPERDFLRHLGSYTAMAELPGYTATSRINPMYNFPGHMIGIVTYRTNALAVFAFRSPWLEYDYHDQAAQKRILLDAFAGHDEWRIPELLDAARQDPDLYFDSISQIDMPQWHHGRVVLVGDAAHCASPLSGRGTSLAMTGAWHLARALDDHPADLEAALTHYEGAQRPLVLRAQATAAPGGDLLMPATQEAIDARNRTLSARA